MNSTENGGILRGKNVLITGGATGIGKAIARVSAREGGNVIILDINIELARITANLLKEQGYDAEAFTCDISDIKNVRQIASQLNKKGMSIDVLVNNAAAWTVSPFMDTKPDDWQRDISVTLLGTLNCIWIFLPEMVQQKAGAIVNIASDAGRVGEPNWAVYSAAKGGVISFTKALAKEVGKDNVRVNAVSPGATRTENARAIFDSIPDMVKRYPLGRLAEPEEVAEAVVFLASDRASFITGQVISVSGGYTMIG